MKEFKLNEFITLKLEEEQTNIYFKNNKEPFIQCKYILLNKNLEELKNIFEDIKSVDELKGKYNQELENIEPKLLNIPPETIFWAHCSNLQVWVENDYNPDLLDSELSFPLLKELMELGDLKAKRIFKEVVAKRFLEGPQSIREVFCNQGYFDTFSKEERRTLFKSGIEIIEKLEDLIVEELKKEEIQMLPVVVSRIESMFSGIMWKEGEVIGLNLHCTNFKELPEFLRELKNLEFLHLGTEMLEKIPDWIGEFKSLKRLELGQGILTKLPESIGQLESLECLKIWHNNIESIPESIGDLSLLKVLRINNTELKSLPYSITKLKSLKNLDLIGNRLTELPYTIGDLISIESIDVRENNIQKIPKELYKNASLIELCLDNPKIIDTNLLNKKVNIITTKLKYRKK